MGMLIDDLLNFSKLGRRDLNFSVIDMSAMVHNCIEELLSNFEANRYEIEVNELPKIKGDAILIRQVLLNLIDNALKYSSKKDHPKIKIDFTENDQYLIYSISDNGAGFDMKYAEK